MSDNDLVFEALMESVLTALLRRHLDGGSQLLLEDRDSSFEPTSGWKWTPTVVKITVEPALESWREYEATQE
jgi:hypothetical protein